MATINALLFDVFGTLVDWRSSIAREAEATLAPRGVAVDWLAFADAWRAQYQPAMDDVRSGRLPFSKLDALHRRNLDVILNTFALDDVDEATRAHLNLAWHRLDAWPDVRPGLDRLRAQFRLAPCSNGKGHPKEIACCLRQARFRHRREPVQCHVCARTGRSRFGAITRADAWRRPRPLSSARSV